MLEKLECYLKKRAMGFYFTDVLCCEDGGYNKLIIDQTLEIEDLEKKGIFLIDEYSPYYNDRYKLYEQISNLYYEFKEISITVHNIKTN